MENDQAILILHYKKEEKKIAYKPNNYSELKDYFLSYYNEKNNKIYEFNYTVEGQLKSNTIPHNNDAVFNKVIKEIIENNCIIFINEEGDTMENKDPLDQKTLDEDDDDDDDENENENENEVKELEDKKPKPKLELFNLELKKVKSEDTNKKNIKTKDDEKDKKINSLELEIKKLKEKLIEKNKELNEIKELNCELNLRINNAQKSSDKKDNLIDENETKIKAMSKSYEENKKLKEKIEKLEKENKKLDSLKKKNEKLESENKKLEKENKKLEK